MQVFLRADGNTHVGLGHIFRCVSLAGMLSPEFTCTLLSKGLEPTVIELLKQESIKYTDLPVDLPYAQEVDYIIANCLNNGDILVLDGYWFDQEYIRKYRKLGISVVQIDDWAAGHYEADAVINHAPGLTIADFDVEAYTRLWVGLDYALLRKPFLLAAGTFRTINQVSSLFINMGGSDVHNVTAKVMRAAEKVTGLEKLIVVAGSANPHLVTLHNLANELSIKAEVHTGLNAEEMVNTISDCHMAVCPASSISIELSAVGIGLVIGLTANNQQRIYQGLIDEKLGLPAGDLLSAGEDDISAAIQFLMQHPAELQQYLTRQKTKIDGSSEARFRAAFRTLYTS